MYSYRGNTMKNKIMLLLVAPFLALSACSGGSSSKQGSSIDPNIEVLDQGNTQVAFNEIDNLVMINEKAQLYIDAMHEQEEKIEDQTRRFYLNGLDGNDTVDVSKFLSQSDASKNRPIVISWDKGDMDYEEIKLALCKDWKFEEGTVEYFDAEDDKVELINLLRAKTYYYRLETEDKSIISQTQKFETADYVRKMNFDHAGALNETIYNVRDLGGYMTSFGVRTNQGLIYRGSEINGEDFTDGGNRHKKNVDDLVMEKQAKVFKIGCELDLRAASGANNMTESALNTPDFPVDYVRTPFNSYASFINDPDNGTPGTLKAAFDVLANADQKTVYYHCWGGADRTGALSFFLNGLCGVSLTDLYIDFELTTQHNSLRSHLKATGSYDFPAMLTAIKALDYYDEDMTLAELSKKFLMEHGIEEETLEKIRSFMIPGYEEGMEEVLAH